MELSAIAEVLPEQQPQHKEAGAGDMGAHQQQKGSGRSGEPPNPHDMDRSPSPAGSLRSARENAGDIAVQCTPSNGAQVCISPSGCTQILHSASLPLLAWLLFLSQGGDSV